MTKQETKVPSNLILTALLSSGITIVVSVCYIVLSILALVYRFNCDVVDPSTTEPAQYFWTTVYRVYILSEDCPYHITSSGLTQSHTVFVFMTITLSFSTVTLITGIILASLINNKDTTQYINVYVYAYVGSWVGSLVVDVTFGTHLGMDYTYLSNQLAGNPTATYDYVVDVVRQGAFYLLAISLKGYAIHLINLILIILMIIYLYDYQDVSKRDEEHSIHKVGTINAFDQPRRHDENWPRPEMYAGPLPRGQLNNAFIDEDPRNSTRNDYYNNSRAPGSFRRSDSWHHQQPSPQPSLQPMPSTSSSRPFSYLEEVRRPVPVKPPTSPANEGWRGAWPPPPVPAPDYSPHGPRRLKSALKPNYM